MGTTYEIALFNDKLIEVDEMSNKLALWVGEEHTDRVPVPDMIKAALKILTVCSYWSEPGAIEEAIQKYKDEGYSW